MLVYIFYVLFLFYFIFLSVQHNICKGLLNSETLNCPSRIPRSWSSKGTIFPTTKIVFETYYMHTTFKCSKVWGFVFERNLLYSHQGHSYSSKNTVRTKLNFHQLLLQASISHDPSEIILMCWFGAQETYLLLSMLKTVLLFNFLWKLIIFVLFFHS